MNISEYSVQPNPFNSVHFVRNTHLKIVRLKKTPREGLSFRLIMFL